MKVLTLHQPYASLIALGVKQIETRSWRAPESLIGQRFAIHAAAKRPEIGSTVGDWMVVRDGFDESTALFLSHRPGGGIAVGPEPRLPLGCIVATAVLDDCVPMVTHDDPTHRGPSLTVDCPHEGEMRHQQGGLWLFGGHPIRVEDQRPYGDYRPGRWAWLLRDVEPVTEKCPSCCGLTWMTPFGENERCGKPSGHRGQHYAYWWASGSDVGRCPTCNGSGHCDPIPFRGGQGLSREWTP